MRRSSHRDRVLIRRLASHIFRFHRGSAVLPEPGKRHLTDRCSSPAVQSLVIFINMSELFIVLIY